MKPRPLLLWVESIESKQKRTARERKLPMISDLAEIKVSSGHEVARNKIIHWMNQRKEEGGVSLF